MADQLLCTVSITSNVIRQIKRYSIVTLVESAHSDISHPVSNMCRARLRFCRPGNSLAQYRSDAPWYALSIVRTCYFAPNICSWRPTEPRFIEADRVLGDLGKPQHLQCRVPVIARGVGGFPPCAMRGVSLGPDSMRLSAGDRRTYRLRSGPLRSFVGLDLNLMAHVVNVPLQEVGRSL